ncbi:hypothetical protein V8E53_009380 [Lactarius tabidus]
MGCSQPTLESQPFHHPSPAATLFIALQRPDISHMAYLHKLYGGRWPTFSSVYLHHPLAFFSAIPEPYADRVTTETGLSQRRFIHTYDLCLDSEVIGFRTVETAEPTVADEWMIDRAHEAQRECQR